MTDNKSNEITYDILEHIAVLDEIGGRDEKWTKEISSLRFLS